MWWKFGTGGGSKTGIVSIALSAAKNTAGPITERTTVTYAAPEWTEARTMRMLDMPRLITDVVAIALLLLLPDILLDRFGIYRSLEKIIEEGVRDA